MLKIHFDTFCGGNHITTHSTSLILLLKLNILSMVLSTFGYNAFKIIRVPKAFSIVPKLECFIL